MELKDLIFNFAYEMALRDATLQGAYEGANKKELRKNEEAKQLVLAYIQNIFSGKNPDFYAVEKAVEDSFQRYIEEKDLKKAEKDNTKNQSEERPSFSFGNSQKLINMTTKYMFISACSDPELREKFRCCHCPMDSIMVDTIIKKVIEESEKDESTRKLKETLFGENRAWRGRLRESWSKMEAEEAEGMKIRSNGQYELFQKIVNHFCEKEQITPLEFDYKYWQKEESSD